MLKINIVCVGKLKEKYLADGVEEYCKRIGRFASINIIELDEYKLTANPSDNVISAALAIEAQQILSKVKGKLIVCDLDGTLQTSNQLAQTLNQWTQSTDTITFVIGSSYGLAQKVKDAADLKICFGRFTLPHQLMRLVLVEQVYRCLTINNNITYHK